MKKETVKDYFNKNWTDSEILMRALVAALKHGFIMSDAESQWSELQSARQASAIKSSVHHSGLNRGNHK